MRQYESAFEILEELAQVGHANIGDTHRSHWETLSVIFSKARLAGSLCKKAEAVSLLDRGVTIASSCGDRLWEKKMRLTRAMFVGRATSLGDGLADINAASGIGTNQLDLAALYYGATAACQIDRTKAGQALGRSLRIADRMSHAALRRDLLIGYDADEVECLDELGPAPTLDTAVALLELGPYTHVLGPEALAVVDGAGCATAAALVATGPKGARVIDARGWDEPAALAALKKKDRLEIIPLGDHRDETWTLVVDPKPEIDQRCTLIAIRKLIGAALALDRYRRDEKQRAALWPAETLAADAGTIWASEQTAELLGIARRIAPTPLSVLLTGETGTGKEMLAQAIHRASDRADRTFLPFNCTAVPREMLDSQLFGYRKGAFTGADTSFAGVIRSAAGGTLFLDEIAEIGLDLQPKLLRFLETHEIHPIGEPQPITVDVRVIAATNANLERLVAEGRFRDDLFYRLNVVQLKLPPLRERREEIPPLVQHYLERYGQEQKKGRLTIADETLEYLLLYSWPGNVRQLANEVRRMVAMAEPGAALTPSVLSPEIQASRRTISASSSTEPELRIGLNQPLPVAVQALEQSMIRHALSRAQGRVEEAARLLGISRKGLFLKRRRWGLAQPAPPPAPTSPAPASPAGYAG